MRLLKESITKEQILELIPEDSDKHKFLNRVDQLGNLELSLGKWNKLFAILGVCRTKTGRSIYIYESPNLNDYDVSCHRQYPHRQGFTAVARQVLPDPKRSIKK